MTEKETMQILAIVRTAYPAIKIENPQGMVQAWYGCLGEFSVDAVMKAARLHMNTSKYFPTPAEIREKIVRAEIAYRDDGIDVNRIQDSNTKLIGSETETELDDYLENLCKFVGLGYPNEIEGE